MSLTICKRLCNECPFIKSSPEGWLGPHTLQDVLDTQSQKKLFSCHMLRKEDMTKESIESGEVRICRGYIASATKSGIEFGEGNETEKSLKALQEMVVREAKEDPDVILSREEFKLHHCAGVPNLKIPGVDLNQRRGYRT